jgi:hypothetical protein
MCTTGSENSAFSAATIRSQGQQSMSPPAMHLPWTAAIDGLGTLRQRRVYSRYLRASTLTIHSRVIFSGAHSRSFRSCPAEKCLPLAFSTMTRTSSSAAARVQAASRSSSSAPVWALAASGRFSVMTATLSLTS